MSGGTGPFADIERVWSTRAGRAMTVDGVIRSWESFTNEVAHGYRATIYDYTNDLSARRMISELEAHVGRLPAHLAQRVAQSDDRLRNATTPEQESIGGYSAEPSEWWWFRRPKKLVGDLAADLARDGDR